VLHVETARCCIGRQPGAALGSVCYTLPPGWALLSVHDQSACASSETLHFYNNDCCVVTPSDCRHVATAVLFHNRVIPALEGLQVSVMQCVMQLL
jgi:hypothetical protein